jgi:hypothetical protein
MASAPALDPPSTYFPLMLDAYTPGRIFALLSRIEINLIHVQPEEPNL